MEQVEQFKYLGVIFQTNLSWKMHLNSVIRTAMSSGRLIQNFIIPLIEFYSS